MNKLFTKIAALALGAAMVVGVGVSVGSGAKAKEVHADNELHYTLTPASGSNNSYTGNCDVAIDGITWNITGNSTVQPWRLGGKSLSSVDRAVYSKTAMDSSITKVDLTVGAASSITVNSLKLIVASDSSFATTIDTVTQTFAANSTISFTPTSGTSWATNAYYKFVFNVSVSGTSNKFVQFTKAEFYKEASASVTGITKKTAPTKTAYVSGESFNPSGLVITVSYSSGDPEDIAYNDHSSDFSWSPTTITAAGNVEIQYKSFSTMKVTQAVTLVTVANVTGVSSAPASVAQGKSINPADVILTVTYSNSTSGTVAATSVTCDTSVVKSGVTATATYSPATGTKTTTFTIEVVENNAYTLVSDPTLLTPGTTFYMVGYSSSTYRIAYGLNSGHAKMSQITSATTISNGLNNGSELETTEGELFTLEGRSGHWNIKNSSGNYLEIYGTSNGNDRWTLSSVTDETTHPHAFFTITSDASNKTLINSNSQTGKGLRYNTGTNDLRAGASTSYGITVFMFANIAPEGEDFGDVDHISIASEPTKNYYHVGQTFDTTGLSIKAYDAADESDPDTHSITITNDATLSIPNGTVFTGAHVANNKEISVSYTDEDSHNFNTSFYTHVYGVENYEKVTSAPDDWSGTYIIVDTDSSNKVALSSYVIDSIDGKGYGNAEVVTESAGVISTGKEMEVVISSYSTGYSIQLKSGKYLSGAASSTENGISVSDSEELMLISYDTSNSKVVIERDWATTKGNYLQFNASSDEKRFRFLANDGASLQLYKLVEQKDQTAVAFAQMILDDIACDGGETAPSSSDWLTLEGLWNDGSSVSAAGKELLLNQSAAEHENPSTDEEILEAAMAKYDYIVGKYNVAQGLEDEYPDFIGREPDPVGSHKMPLDVLGTTASTGTIAIVIVSVIGVSALGGFFFLRKRKEI